MSDARDLSAEALLAIPADEPEHIFPATEAELKLCFRRLARKWHPNVNAAPEATAVMAHLNLLHKAALRKISAGSWMPPNTVLFDTQDGRRFSFNYLAKDTFELGKVYIGQRHVAYVVDPDFADLYAQGLKVIKGLSFAHDKMREEMRPRLPQLKEAFATTAGQHVLLVSKDPDLVRLRDVLSYCKGKVEPKHVAWILSNLYHTACYLKWAGLTHNDLSLDTFFVSPQHHGGALLGGWFYAASSNEKLQAVPTRTAELAPLDVLRSRKPDARVDLELIRAIGRELLGDPMGSGLSWNKEVPKALADWLRQPTSGRALEEYRTYVDHVLPGSFGPRRYVKWDIKATDIMQPRRM